MLRTLGRPNQRGETRGRLFKSATCIYTINIQRELSVTRLLRMWGKKNLSSWFERAFHADTTTVRTKVWTAYLSIRVLVPAFHSPSDTPETPFFVPPAVFLRLSFLIWGVCLLLRKGADGAGFNFPDRTALNGGAPQLNNIIKKCTRKNFISQHCHFFFSFCRFNTDCWWISVSLNCIEGFWTWTAKMVWNSWGMVGTLLMLC